MSYEVLREKATQKTVSIIASFLLIVALPFGVKASEWETAEQVYHAAYASAAVYEGEWNALPGEELKHEEMNFSVVKIDYNNVLIGERTVNGVKEHWIAIAGTESKAGVKKDLDTKLVPFEGDNISLVHQGFYRLALQISEDSEVKNILTQLKSNREERLFITGHSLGGATAILMGMRWLTLGAVEKDQLRVITFGAPLMGNDAFLKGTEEMNIIPFEIKSDVVPSLLQSLKSDYKGFLPSRKVWRVKDPGNRNHHGMAFYLSEAQRQINLLKQVSHNPKDKKFYIALPTLTDKANLPEIEEVAYKNGVAHVLFRNDEERSYIDYEEKSMTEALKEALDNGYRYALLTDLEIKTKKNSKLNEEYTVVTTVTIYDVKTFRGLSSFTFSSNEGGYTVLTKTMSLVSREVRPWKEKWQ